MRRLLVLLPVLLLLIASATHIRGGSQTASAHEISQAEVDQLISDLDSDSFVVRRDATNKLVAEATEGGANTKRANTERIGAALKAARTGNPTLEVRRRVEQIEGQIRFQFKQRSCTEDPSWRVVLEFNAYDVEGIKRMEGTAFYPPYANHANGDYSQFFFVFPVDYPRTYVAVAKRSTKLEFPGLVPTAIVIKLTRNDDSAEETSFSCPSQMETPTPTPTPTPGPIGGVSLDPGAGALPLQSPPSSGSDGWLLAEAIAGTVATAIVLGGAAWYVRRRGARRVHSV